MALVKKQDGGTSALSCPVTLFYCRLGFELSCLGLVCVFKLLVCILCQSQAVFESLLEHMSSPLFLRTLITNSGSYILGPPVSKAPLTLRFSISPLLLRSGNFCPVSTDFVLCHLIIEPIRVNLYISVIFSSL